MSKSKYAEQHQNAQKDYQMKTEHLVREFLRSSKLPDSVVNLNCFQELIHHLNPMALVPIIPIKEENVMGFMANRRKDVLRPKLMREFRCFFCGKKVPTLASNPLLVTEVCIVLMATVIYGAMSMNDALNAACQTPSRMCLVHNRFVYDMLCKATGVTTCYDVYSAPEGGKLLRALKVFKDLRMAREIHDRRKPVNNVMGSFKFILRNFFKQYTPVEIEKRGDEERIKRMQTYSNHIVLTTRRIDTRISESIEFSKNRISTNILPSTESPAETDETKIRRIEQKSSFPENEIELKPRDFQFDEKKPDAGLNFLDQNINDCFQSFNH